MNQSRTIRLPAHVVKELNVVLRALRHLEMHGQPDGRDVALEDVAHLLDKPVEQVRKVLGYNERTTSLDAPLDRDGGGSIGDTLADEDALSPELVLHNSEIEAWVRMWLAELNERQRTVIERRYGLNDRDVATLEELAREIGVTRERVRQIQAEALEKLRARLEAARARSRRAPVSGVKGGLRAARRVMRAAATRRSAEGAGRMRTARRSRQSADARSSVVSACAATGP